MSHWTFSPSSQQLLQRCIAAAQPQDDNNKWVRCFKRETQDLEKHNLTCENLEQKNPNIIVNENLNCESGIINEELIDYLENESIQCVDILIEECRKNDKVLSILAQRLSALSVNKLCKYAFSTENVDCIFLENFIINFIPAYIKKEYNRLCIDILFQANKINPKSFKTLFEIIIRDDEIPSQILSDFASVLNDEGQTKLMENLLDIELSKEHFVKHLSTINIIYKKSTESSNIQKYIFKNLSQCGKSCKNDRSYGKLFFSFLQKEKNMHEHSDYKTMKKLLDMHTSPFRRPCEIILYEINVNTQ